MATELITRTWCDRCLVEHDKRTDAAHSDMVAVGNVKRNLDLCEACYALTLGPVLETLKRYGNPPQGAPKSVDKRPSVMNTSPSTMAQTCPECGRTVATRGSLLGHLRGPHGLTLVEASQRIGGDYPCDECGFLAADAGGLAVHQRLHQRAATKSTR